MYCKECFACGNIYSSAATSEKNAKKSRAGSCYEARKFSKRGERLLVNHCTLYNQLKDNRVIFLKTDTSRQKRK
jgi:hypothetical protein